MTVRVSAFVVCAVGMLFCCRPSMAASEAARAQCSGWIAGPLAVTPDGADGPVYAETVWDPDGAGPQPSLLIVAGDFSSIGGVSAHNIAAWDGLVWRPLGAGTDLPVRALAVHAGKLAAGGGFLHAGGAPAVGVAIWNGSFWLPCGDGVPGGVSALVEYDGLLVAGGTFVTPAPHIAAWNGASWQGLGDGMDGNVYALATYNGDLYAGGDFLHSGSVDVHNVGRWNGTSWFHMGDGVYEPWKACTSEACYVTSMTVFDGSLLVCGGSYWPQIWRWDGANWSPDVVILGGVVNAIGVSGGMLVATGNFLSDCVDCGAHPLRRIAAWTGTQWIQLGNGIGSPDSRTNETGHALVDYGGYLYVGGAFATANDAPASNIAKVLVPTGTWSLPVTRPRIAALGTYGSKLAIAGTLSESTPSGHAYHVLSWDGHQLSNLGAGPNAPVNAAIGYTDNSQFPANHLIVGGQFTSVDGVPAQHIAVWTESSAYPFNSWSGMGSLFGDVHALERLNGLFVAGGDFTSSNTSSTPYVARWDGSAWNPLGTGMNGPVFALRTYATRFSYVLLAGGNFTTANGSPASCIAYWTENPNSLPVPWQPLGAGFNGPVYAIERFGGVIYAAGAFSASGGTPLQSIAKWTGSQWVSVGSGFDGPVYALKGQGSYLYAAGDFATADGNPAPRMARWDGAAWSAVDGGADDAMLALAPYGSELVAGGAFQSVEGGALGSPGVARLSDTGLPWLTQQPASQTLNAGQTADFAVQPVDGYSGLGYAWRRDMMPLADGETPQGSLISGANTASLAIEHLAAADSGTYDCVITNACGSTTSSSATLAVNFPLGVSDPPASHTGLALALRPNPMVATSLVTFFVPREEAVDLAIYDASGRQVTSLLSGTLPAGAHHVVWDGRDRGGRAVGPGIFIVKLRAGVETATSRGILVR